MWFLFIMNCKLKTSYVFSKLKFVISLISLLFFIFVIILSHNQSGMIILLSKSVFLHPSISNNNESISLKKYSSSCSSSSNSSPGSPSIEGFCIRQRLRPPKPPSRAAIITWFRDEELPRGAGLDPSCSRIAPWFHGKHL